MKFGIVLVTYNRLDKLKITLDKYDSQTYSPEYVLIVNNCSTDGTMEYLKEWQSKKSSYKKIVKNQSVNSGGSGGFYEGLKESLKLSAEWIVVADDDAFPDKNALKEANKFLEKHQGEDISAICSTVINHGKNDYMHRRNIEKGWLRVKHVPSKETDYQKEFFPINCFSYVGAIINQSKLKEVGLPKKEYFIYYDDSEHSYRLSKVGEIFCVPKIKFVHDAPAGIKNAIVGWKQYYYVRNNLDFVKTHFSKRYYNFGKLEICIKSNILITIFGKNKFAGYKLTHDAKKASVNGTLGVHDMYKPGWNAGEKQK